MPTCRAFQDEGRLFVVNISANSPRLFENPGAVAAYVT
jgi:hypothetical protein